MNNVFKIAVAPCLAIALTISAAVAAETVFKTDKTQKMAASLVFETVSLKTMTEIPFSITLDDQINSSIQSAACDLTMPAMPMPENRPDLTCSGNLCSGKAVFTMAGKWQATFGLIMKDGSHSSIVFDIPMVKMK